MRDEIKIVGKSTHTKKLLEFIKVASRTDAKVLLIGETGVGKEIVARKIHSLSARKNKPFLKVNCANLNENLLESELFGYTKGAFTGATINKPGLLEAANDGSFFFDEIADVNPFMQAKLLSVIEDNELRRLGENVTRKIDVRFIFATNKDIYKLVGTSKFRDDLYFRVSILSFHIPSLKERKGDIPLLVESFLEKIDMEGSRKLSITQTAIDKLMMHTFPGNIRELENTIERASILSKSFVIRAKDIEFPKIKIRTEDILKSRFSKQEIISALIKHKGNKARTATEVGVSRRHIYRLLKFMEIDRK